MDSISLRIADWPVTLLLSRCSARDRARLAERYQAFLVAPEAEAPSIEISVEPGPLFIPREPRGTWQIQTTLRDGRLDFVSHSESGWMDLETRRGALLLRSDGDPENFLRVLYAWRCLREGSLLLHACGVIRDGRGYVFFGPSGSGKTTIARHSSDLTVLSDDLVIIKRQKEAWRVCGVPFRGDFPEAPRTNDRADLVGLYALAKDTRHYLSDFPLSETVARLTACVPFVMGQPENARRVTELCTELATHVPVRVLHFLPDRGFWNVIHPAE